MPIPLGVLNITAVLADVAAPPPAEAAPAAVAPVLAAPDVEVPAVGSNAVPLLAGVLIVYVVEVIN